MRNGDFADGEHLLRAKIDMSSPNMNLRDPALYRIRHVTHQRTGDNWCIYPMYDFAHTLSDAFEEITHSLCTLEFEDHRPLYDWFLDQLKPAHRPRQIEFSRLNLAYSITSKRKLNALVEEGIVEGWNDPRMPTIAGMRRRGYPSAALREFVKRGGVTKKDKLIEMGVLENCIRENLADDSERRMGVLRPLKVVLTNYPEDKVEMMEAMNHPGRPELGTRELPLSRELWIEQDDFMEEAPRKFFRLKPDGEVRSAAMKLSRTKTVKSLSFVVATTRTRAVVREAATAKSKGLFTGFLASMLLMPACDSMIDCSRKLIRTRLMISTLLSIAILWKLLRRSSSRHSQRLHQVLRCNSNDWVIFALTVKSMLTMRQCSIGLLP